MPTKQCKIELSFDAHFFLTHPFFFYFSPTQSIWKTPVHARASDTCVSRRMMAPVQRSDQKQTQERMPHHNKIVPRPFSLNYFWTALHSCDRLQQHQFNRSHSRLWDTRSERRKGTKKTTLTATAARVRIGIPVRGKPALLGSGVIVLCSGLYLRKTFFLCAVNGCIEKTKMQIHSSWVYNDAVSNRTFAFRSFLLSSLLVVSSRSVFRKLIPNGQLSRQFEASNSENHGLLHRLFLTRYSKFHRGEQLR